MSKRLGRGSGSVLNARRGFAAMLVATSLTFACLPASAGARGLVDLVNPFVGTNAGALDYGTGGGAGNTFPGATVPFGMAVFSPDTIPSAINYSGGYSYPDRQLRGFSLTHFSGAGCALLADVPILPLAGPLTSSPVVPGSSDLVPGVVPSFDHKHESASPGSYEVTLNPGTGKAIRSQLTATTRNAVGRFSFPAGGTGTMMVNAGGSTIANYDAGVKVNAARREISGSSESGAFCAGPTRYTVYFAARFSRPFSAHGTWTKGDLQPGSKSAHDSSPNAFGFRGAPGNPSTTAQAGAYASFDTGRRRSVEMKVGVSFVSVAEARKNLVESRGMDVAGVKARARQKWARTLGSIKIGGGRTADRRTFATSLYHSLVDPSIASDVDGSYLGQDGKVHVAKGRKHYTDISGWDVYRSQIQLLSMIKPKVASDVSQSLVAMAEQGGCLPRWPYANQNSNVMAGDPSSPIIATTYALGARSFDAKTALKKMVRGASSPCHSDNGDYTEREALDDYLRLGWVPQELNVSSPLHSLVYRDRPWGPASVSLEYALADFTVSRLARSLGQKGIAAKFAKRADWWRNSVNPATRTIQPRFGNGEFLPGAGPKTEDGFVEGSAAQYNWMVPQNMAGLFRSMGGRKVALARLNHFFTDLNAGPASDKAFLGNEPTLQTPWIYNWLGRPNRAQSVARRGLLQLYAPTPGGMPGNDDGGTMSAWAVLTSIGMSPVVPGTDVMPLGSPLFPKVSIRLRGGTLKMSAPKASRKNFYVRGLTLRGKGQMAPWTHFGSLVKGGRMNWDLSGKATRWGRKPSLAPPSYGTR